MLDVFPNMPTGTGVTNATIQQKIAALRELRNDIAHNSPVWKHKSVTNEAQVLQYVNAKIDYIVRILRWLSPEKVDWLNVHMLVAEAKRVASLRYLHLCQRKHIDSLTSRKNDYKRNFNHRLKKLQPFGFDLIKTSTSEIAMVIKVSE